jgi:hypothetical protein
LLAAAKGASYTASQIMTKDDPVQPSKTVFLFISASALLAGCSRNGELDSSGGVNVVRSSCPAVAVPANTGDITLFNPPQSRDSRAIDVVALITNLRSTCAPQGEDIVANATFDVQARRADAAAARDVTLPYFATVMQGGRVVVSKRLGSIALHFDAGNARAMGKGTGWATVNRAAATLAPDIQNRITRKRKAGDEDAATDPMADPIVKAALERANFELLIGFQLSADQLQYNATR